MMIIQLFTVSFSCLLAKTLDNGNEQRSALMWRMLKNYKVTQCSE